MQAHKAKTSRPDLRDALHRQLCTRWVLRADLNGVQWALLVECCPGAAPGSGGFLVQMLREDGQPAHKLDFGRYDRESGLTFQVPGEGIVVCPMACAEGLEGGEVALTEAEAQGFSWDGTIYEPDRAKLAGGIIEWKPYREGENDG